MEPYAQLEIAGAVLLCVGASLACASAWYARRFEVGRAKADLAGLRRFEVAGGSARGCVDAQRISGKRGRDGCEAGSTAQKSASSAGIVAIEPPTAMADAGEETVVEALTGTVG